MRRLSPALFFLAATLFYLASCGRQASKDNKAVNPQDLYTGKEAKKPVALMFVSEAKAIPELENRDIYETASLVSQAKQVVLDLLAGPKSAGLVGAFPKDCGLRELFLDKTGLCVVDFSSQLQSSHPGGSTGEYLTLATLVKTLTSNFPEIQSVQVLVNGERLESLAGHFDLSAPLDKNSF